MPRKSCNSIFVWAMFGTGAAVRVFRTVPLQALSLVVSVAASPLVLLLCGSWSLAELAQG
jgi:hypothetical protein